MIPLCEMMKRIDRLNKKQLCEVELKWGYLNRFWRGKINKILYSKTKRISSVRILILVLTQKRALICWLKTVENQFSVAPQPDMAFWNKPGSILNRGLNRFFWTILSSTSVLGTAFLIEWLSPGRFNSWI